MKRIIFLLFAIMFVAATNNLNASDWRYLGCVLSGNNECTEMMYFDAASIQHLKNGTVRAWTKSIAQSEIQKYEQNKEFSKSAVEKIKQGYVPPYITVRSEKQQEEWIWYITYVCWEEIANYPRIKSKTQFLHQIDCRQRTYDSLQRIWYKNDGTIGSTSEKVYSSLPINPDSIVETLYIIMCRGSE